MRFHWLAKKIDALADWIDPDNAVTKCDRCGRRYTYLGHAPICLHCDKPGDYIARGRPLRP